MKKQIQETPQEKAYRENIEQIAGNISKLARGVASLLGGPMNRRALIVLLSNSSGQKQHVVEDVLKALEDLEKDWLK